MEDRKLKEYYDLHTEQFTDVIQTAHILVKDEEAANKLYEEVINGADFGKLAKENSLCPSSARGGDLGFFPRGLFVPPYEEASRKLKEIGEISKPVQSQFGWHIIKLLGKKDVLPYEECKETIAMIVERK